MIKDKYELKGFSAPKMPKLKGHVKLILRDHKTGKVEVSEGDNIVTNAVADIFTNNYLGGIDYSKMMPLWQKWFGGVLCFEQAHANLDADKYYLNPDSTQHLVAHAGQTAIDPNHDDDVSRGNPTQSAYVETENSIKMVWEWGTTHGNGTIRALSLTHSDTGSYGTGSESYDFQNNFTPYEALNQTTNFWTARSTSYKDVSSVMAMYDDSHGLAFYRDSDDSSGTDLLNVYIRKLAYSKAGLYQTLTASDNLQRTFQIQLPFTLYAQPYYYFEPSTKYLWIFHNLTGVASYDNDDIKYCKIDCENEELVDLGSGVYYGTITSDTQDIAPLGIIDMEFANILRDGDYFYFPTATNPVMSGAYDNRGSYVTGYKKINLSNISEQESIEFNEVQKVSQSLTGKGILINNGRVINGVTGYTCKPFYTITNTRVRNLFLSSPNNPSTFAQFHKSDGYSAMMGTPQYILANKMLLTTKFNLQSAITKTSGQSMTVEYTLQEV